MFAINLLIIRSLNLNKTLLLATGGIVSLVAVIIIFSSNDFDGNNAVVLDTEQANKNISKTSIEPRELAIDYKISEVEQQESKLKIVKKERLKLEPFMEAKALDRSGTFEIILMNAHKDKAKATGAYKTLQGDIDGEPFTLKIPQHLIDEGVGVTELHIKNRKTGEVSSVAAVFIDDMKNPAIKQKISVDSKDVQNFQQTSAEQISPLLPGEMRD